MDQNNSNGADMSDNSSEKETKKGKGDGRKQSLYFPGDMLQQLQEEAKRLDRSLSWVVQRCIKEGLPEVRQLPTMSETDEE